jgi:hypothetical protein
MTQVHPAAKAAPTFRVIIALGKFLKQTPCLIYVWSF